MVSRAVPITTAVYLGIGLVIGLKCLDTGIQHVLNTASRPLCITLFPPCNMLLTIGSTSVLGRLVQTAPAAQRPIFAVTQRRSAAMDANTTATPKLNVDHMLRATHRNVP